MKNWFANLNLKSKFAVSFGILIVLTLSTSTLSFVNSAKQSGQLDTIREVNVAELRLLQDFQQRIGEVRSDALEIAAHSGQRAETELKSLSSNVKLADEALSKLGSLAKSTEVKKAHADTSSSWERYKEAWAKNENQVVNLDGTAALSLIDKTTGEVFEKDVKPSAVALSEAISAHLDQVNHLADQQASTSQAVNLGFAFVALAIGLTTAFALTRSILLPLGELDDRMKKVGANCIPNLKAALEKFEKGDLTFEVVPSTTPINTERKDELGKLSDMFNTMLSSLQQTISSYNQSRVGLASMVEAIRSNSETVESSSSTLRAISQEAGSAARQIAEGSEQLATDATEAAAIMEQTLAQIDSVRESSQHQVTAVEKASNSLRDAEGGVTAVAAAAQQMFAVATEGNRSVSETLTAMEAVQARVTDTTVKVKDLDAKGIEIGKIVATIQGIAGQTNLLALNAAIEAARAGEHGRGFAVVADEVRKLAEGASAASKEIESLIGGITQTVAETVLAIQATSTDVSRGTELSQQAGKALEEILRASEEVATQSESVAKIAMDAATTMTRVASVAEENLQASTEMVVGAKRVSDAITNVAAVSEESAAGAEELSASITETSQSAEHLSSLSDELSEVVSRFKTDNESKTVSLRIAA